MNLHLPLSFILLLVLFQNSFGQGVSTNSVGISSEYRMDDNTLIYNKDTGQRITMTEYVRLTRETPKLYHLVPQINEYGKPGSYILRKRTQEELAEDRIIYQNNDFSKPLVGKPLPPFVMEGADGKTYRSEGLKGSYILLSFWLRLRKPFFSDTQTKDLAKLVENAQAKGIQLLSLGTTPDSKEECIRAMTTYSLGMIPVPGSYEFIRRYGMSIGSYLLIGPDGNLLAIVEDGSPLGLDRFLVK